MDYKKVYENKLELVKEWYNDPTATVMEKERLEAMFPELKESEKRIIEATLDVVTKYGPKAADINLYRDMIAWVESKGEQKGDKGNEKETPNSEQKPHEWSEIEDIAVHLENLGNTAMANTLRSFRQQANHEWNEDDEKTMDLFLHKLEVCDLLSNKENNWILDKFKSMKERVQPQSQWKPSKEQMGALSLACDGKLLSLDYLNSLYNDLKKLREE